MVVVASGCSENYGSSLADASEGDPSNTDRPTASGGSTSFGNQGVAVETPTPVVEVEATVAFETPQSSVNYVYATNPDRDSVAVINASTLDIHVVQTGDQPRYLKTIPGRDAALLVDVGAGDLAYIETHEGRSSVQYFRDLPLANVIEVAPDGKHAVAYFDVTRMQQGRFDTLQDVSVISLDGASPHATRITVGFKPRQLIFAGGAAGSAAAYVVTDDGISILDFAKIDGAGKGGIADIIPTFSATENQGLDISVTPDGRYAIGRLERSARLRLVDLQTSKPLTLDAGALLGGTVSGGAGGANSGIGGAEIAGAGGARDTTLGEVAGSLATAGVGSASSAGNSAVTSKVGSGGTSSRASTTVAPPELSDLDLSPDGTFALAISRERATMLRIPIPAGFVDPSQVTRLHVENVTVGAAAISPNGHWAVLYTTVVQSERRIVIVDLTGAIEPRVLGVTKAVRGIAFSSSGDQAYLAHYKADGNPLEAGLSPEAVMERSYGYTLVDLKKAFRKLQGTEAEPKLTLATPGAPYAFLTFQNSSTLVQRLDMESLQVTDIQLGSEPIALGAVTAARRIFVGQQYSGGRLTFIDWETLAMQTVTGYELNSKIRE
jgi:hypothetical protein